MLTPEIGERLARLEQKSITMDEKLDVLGEKVDQMSTNLQQHKGFIGGVVFVVSALWGIFVVFFAKIFPPPAH